MHPAWTVPFAPQLMLASSFVDYGSNGEDESVLPIAPTLASASL
jgi:hypothetical protein